MEKHSPYLFRYITIILVSISLVLANAPKSYSQIPDKQGTLEYLNRLGADSLIFSLSGMNLKVELKREGKLIREDQALVTDLDTIVKFESQSNLICVNCLGDTPGCVTRELTIQKIKRPYNRMSLNATRADAEKYTAALQHLIKMMSVKKYHDEITLP